ncbi:MAG: sugar phosphate nucleotidyltransferase [Desulfosalsimonadaceae bacterium]
MKALLLAAGFATRLAPYSRNIPKPLFSINNQPALEHLINSLVDAGCSSIIINTHHLHEQIAAFVESRNFPIPVHTLYEPEILDTGGAIGNAADLLGGGAFLVINSDIVTDLDFNALYCFHRSHRHPATLVMHEREEFNSVAVDEEGFVRAFPPDDPPRGAKRMAFTGIQVLDACILEEIPAKKKISSITIYKSLLARSICVKAYIPENFYWQDIGSPERYQAAAFACMAPDAFRAAFGRTPPAAALSFRQLAGDGSTRSWYRVFAEGRSLIMADHGIHTSADTAEIDSFAAIGAHLYQKQIPVPRIFLHDRCCGLVFLQDLGDTLLYDWLQNNPCKKSILPTYRQVIRDAVKMSVAGAEGLDPALCYQGPAYDRDMILEKECRYFVEAFLQGFLQLSLPPWPEIPEGLYQDFSLLADTATENGTPGFMHRDLQSRNIMIRNEQIYFIDFQAGRTGPFQYDLAALLIDPYACLPENLQKKLLDFALAEMGRYRSIDRTRFLSGYRACCLTRTLQTLGAFGYLTTKGEKPFFRRFMPAATKNLLRLTGDLSDVLPVLARVARQAAEAVEPCKPA